MHLPTLSKPSRTNEYDVIVVGARAAGAATAMLLGRAGKRVLLVDRSAYGADTLSTHALLRGGVLQLQRWGLLDTIRREGTPPIRRTRFHYGADVVDVSIRAEHGFDALYAPRRTVLDRILVDAARSSGAEVTYGLRVTDLLRGRDGAVEGIRGQNTDGEEIVAGAPLVIGADGVNSTIARLVEAPTNQATTTASAFVYGYFAGARRERVRLVLPAGRERGRHPDERRRRQRLRRPASVALPV